MTRPLIATTGVTLDTDNGGKGYQRTDKGDLFIAAVGAFSQPNPERVRELTERVALDDPAWVLRFDRWLRDEGNVRSTTIEVACAFVHGRLEAGVKDETGPGPAHGLNRAAINVACLRADEPAKLIEHWRQVYGRKLPMPVKRGVADAVQRLYDERSALRYDNVNDATRMGDVIELVHPRAKDANQDRLFEYLINRRHGWRDSSHLYAFLPMIAAAEGLWGEKDRANLRERLIADPSLLKEAGWTWENLATLGPMDKDAWEAVIPTMGYMALLRNLRNFDQVEISDEHVRKVKEILSSPSAVAKSRQFPFRFFSAWKHSGGRWASTLETALQLSLPNVPHLPGDTLIMVDCSISMDDPASGNSRMSRRELASIFGTALATRCERYRLVRYGDTHRDVTMESSLLETVGRQYPPMGGTQTTLTARRLLDEYPQADRLVILTDEQANSTRNQQGSTIAVSDVVPDDVMLYTWNLGGRQVAHAEASPTKHEFGGLTDQCFALIPLIESGVRADWPF